MNRQAEHDIRRKSRILEHVKQSGNMNHTSLKYGISRYTFYRWNKLLEKGGNQALFNSKPCPENPKIRTPKVTEEKTSYVRNEL